MADPIDHATIAEHILSEPAYGFAAGNDPQGVAQAHATLALAAEVKALRESFGSCAHGYTICPFCIRNAMEGVGL